MNGEREARFWSDRKKAFREFDHDEMTYATQALMGIYDALEDIRAILKDIDEDVTEPKMPSAQPEITLESAIDYLHSIGWMQEHDRVLTESAQPERKTGRWEKVYGEHIYAELRPWTVCCSECGMIGGGTRYCPNCGADMRGGNDETD